MKTFFAIALLVIVSSVHAGIYECDSENGEPFHKDISPSSMSFTKTMPRIRESGFNNVPSKHLPPYLVYYVVDTKEPFMQYSVKYELAELKKACLESTKVNYVAVVNSLYVEKNEIIVCKNSQYQKINLVKYPNFDKKLKGKLAQLQKGDNTDDSSFALDFFIRFPLKTNNAFALHPLSHPDFLNDFLALVKSSKDLFPANGYMPFLNIKSHGNETHPLTGLYSCQENAKKKTQTSIISALLTPEEISKLESNEYNPKDIEPILHKLALGHEIVSGRKKLEFSSELGKFELGKFELGKFELSNSVFGLGSNDGLGADSAFGTYNEFLTNVLLNQFGHSSYLGFLMVESCDTNRNRKTEDAFVDNVIGSYSAQHSLWYRNLNWWSMLKEANGSSPKLLEILSDKTSNIENMKVTQ